MSMVPIFASIVLFLYLPPVCVAVADTAMSVDETIQGILGELQTWQRAFEDTDESMSRPFVTVAFAQSLDGYMASYTDESKSSTTSNFPLSGDESLLLTHALRSIHDGIMVGGRTLSIDNPRLTNRLWKTSQYLDTTNPDGALQFNSPRVIVLDSKLAHARQLGQSLRLQRPILCCSSDASLKDPIIDSFLAAGAEIIPCKLSAQTGSLNLRDVLQHLKCRYGLRHVLIEGGPKLLTSFFAEGLVDALCITVAPKFLHDGVAPSFSRSMATQSDLPPTLDLAASSPLLAILGHDTVHIARFPRET